MLRQMSKARGLTLKLRICDAGKRSVSVSISIPIKLLDHLNLVLEAHVIEKGGCKVSISMRMQKLQLLGFEPNIAKCLRETETI